MATSTGDLIRADLVAAIQAIATDLGFDDADGNIQSYLLAEEQPEAVTKYLMADVSGERRVRAWGVQVYEAEDFTRGGNREVGYRDYSIVLESYYGFHGSNPTNTMLTHARLIREAIKGLTLRLNERVSSVRSMGQLDISPQQIPGIEVAVAVGRMSINAERYNPDF
jgi:hypothetical protein